MKIHHPPQYVLHMLNAFVGMALVAGPATLRAQTGAAEAAQEPVLLMPVTIVGDWLSNPSTTTVFDHAGARDLVTRDQFPAQGATSVREAISRIPGVNAPENNGTGSHDMAMNIGLRGLNPRLTSRSTVLIDGIPLPFAPYGQPQLSFAPITLGNLDAVDVIRGGGAVRYGPQNVGGIINFVTRRIPNQFAASVSLQSSFFTGSSQGSPKTSANAMLGTTLDSGLGFAVLYSGTRGKDWREHSKTQIDDLILKARYQNGAHTVHGMVQRYEGEADMPGGLSVADYQRDPWQSTRPHDRFWGHRNLYTAGYEYVPNAQQRFSIQAFRTETLRSGYLDQGNTGLTLSPRDYSVDGIETRFSQGLQWGGVRHEIGVGHRYVSESSEELRYKVPLSLGRNPTSSDPFDRHTKGDTKANAFFVDDRISVGAWTIVPGLRYERIRSGQSNLINGKRDDVSYNTLLPALNVTYALSDQWNLYASADSSFGTVQYSKMSTAVTSGSAKPEKGRAYEIGTRYDDGSLQLAAGLFLINFSNQYDSNQTTNSVYARGKTRHQGLEASVAYDLGSLDGSLRGLSVYGNYAYVDARIVESGPNKGNKLPFSSKHRLTIGADWRSGPWTAGFSGIAQSSQFADNANTVAESARGNNGRIPGYMVWNLQGSHTLKAGGSDLTLGAGVRNLFDKRYYTRSFDDNNSGIYAGQPRTVYVQADVKF